MRKILSIYASCVYKLKGTCFVGKDSVVLVRLDSTGLYTLFINEKKCGELIDDGHDLEFKELLEELNMPKALIFDNVVSYSIIDPKRIKRKLQRGDSIIIDNERHLINSIVFQEFIPFSDILYDSIEKGIVVKDDSKVSIEFIDHNGSYISWDSSKNKGSIQYNG